MLEDGRPATVDWDSSAAEAAGYVDGALPKGVESPVAGADDGSPDDDGPDDAPENDAAEAASEESTEAGKPCDDR